MVSPFIINDWKEEPLSFLMLPAKVHPSFQRTIHKPVFAQKDKDKKRLKNAY
jgi:hypothetical protein